MGGSIENNAKRLRELKASINRTFREHPHGPEHHAACAEFHRNYDDLAYPGGLNKGMKLLASHNAKALETALRFLEADPSFHRSGHIKEEVLRRLKHFELDGNQKSRLARLIIRSLESGGRREFRGYSRLATVVYSGQLLEAIQVRLTSDPEAARRAADVLHVLHSRGVISR